MKTPAHNGRETVTKQKTCLMAHLKDEIKDPSKPRSEKSNMLILRISAALNRIVKKLPPALPRKIVSTGGVGLLSSNISSYPQPTSVNIRKKRREERRDISGAEVATDVAAARVGVPDENTRAQRS